MDAKRQNKLLKLAIGRLQSELEKKESPAIEAGDTSIVHDGAKVFLTENQNQQPDQRTLLGESSLPVKGNYLFPEKSQF